MERRTKSRSRQIDDQITRSKRRRAVGPGERKGDARRAKLAKARAKGVKRAAQRTKLAAELARGKGVTEAARAAQLGPKQARRLLADPVEGKEVLDAVEAALQEAGSSPVEVVLAMRRMALADPLRLVDDSGNGMRSLTDLDEDARSAVGDIVFSQALDKEGDTHDLMTVSTVDAKTRAGAQQTLARMHKLLIDRKEHSTPPGRPFEVKPETKADVIAGLLSRVRPRKDPK